MLRGHFHRRPALGFTLIEILTVIAIVGILAAILVPVAGGVRARAYTARAMSNLRQLAIAHYTYATENKNTFPPLYNNPGDSSWQSHLEPYVASKNGTSGNDRYRLRQDPSSIFNVPDSLPRDERPTNAASIARNFYSGSAEFRPNRVPTPGRYILLGECEESNKDRLNTLRASGEPYKSGQAPIGFRRENGTKALMAFCDTSVRALAREQLRDDISPANGNPWRWW
jgi:prepilin-type N-terminal cleavage/methylation domain